MCPQQILNYWAEYKGGEKNLKKRRFLGAFAKLRKGTISFVMSIRPSVRMEQLVSHLTYFHEIRYSDIFRKTIAKIRVSLKSDKNNVRTLYVNTDIYFWSYLAQFFLEREMFQTKVVEKIKIHFVFVTYSRKSYRLWDKVEECGRARQAINGNTSLCDIHYWRMVTVWSQHRVLTVVFFTSYYLLASCFYLFSPVNRLW